MVIEVLIAQRQAENPLADKRRQTMLDQFAAPSIAKASGKALDKSDRPIARQNRQPPPALRPMQTPANLRYTASASGSPSNPARVVLAKQLSQIRNPDAPTLVRNAG
jgi:hypothetical protein